MYKKFLLLIALFASIPLSQSADTLASSSFTAGGLLTYTYFSTGVASVKSCNTKAETVEVPETVTLGSREYKVTKIENSAFSGCKLLTKVVLPNSITEIGNMAFKGDSLLAEINIPETITSIGRQAFEGCKTLNNVTLPQGLTKIDDFTFQGCASLDNIDIPASVTEFGYSCFKNTGFSSFIIPETVIKMGNSVFENCKKLVTVTIPESITSINIAAFAGCESLVEFKTAKKLNTIFTSAFKGCLSLTEINDPAHYIYSNAFENCTGLKKASVSSSAKEMFKGCTALETAMIFYSGVGESMFEGCTNLKSVSILYSGGSIGARAFYGCESLESAPIQNGIISIGSLAFAGCPKIKSVSIPRCVKEVADAFEPVEGLEIKINSLLSEGSSSSAPYHFLSVAKPAVVYAHLMDKSKIEESYSGKVIYFEEMDIASSKSWLARIDFNINATSENLALPLRNIYYAPLGTLNKITDIPLRDDHSYSITGLQPEQVYYVVAVDKNNEEHNYTFKTTKPTVTFSGHVYNQTQTSLEGRLTASSDESVQPLCYILDKECKNNQWTKVKGLIPGKTYTLTGYADYNGKRYNAKESVTTSTLGMNPKLTCTATPTKLIFTGSYQKGDATVEKFGFTSSNTKNDFDGNTSMTISGLEPRASYTAYFGVKVAENYSPYRASLYGTTADVTWSEGDFTATSTKSVRLRVATNCDAETGTGIEWRRNDAPDNVKSTYVACPVVDGILVGSLRNLNPDVYYKFRPVYETSNGTKYYGTWAGFYSGDASVYFDPEVRTLDDIEIFENSALVASYVMPGSDDIKRQGIQYWRKGTTQGRADERMELITSGIKSTVTLPDLFAGTEYAYRAFAETASGTIYGDEKSFVTKGTSGIDYIISNESEKLSIVLKENPARGQIQFSINGSTESIFEVSLLSMSGNIIRHEMRDASSEWMILDANCSSGIYLLMVNDGKTCASTRVIIMN